MPVQYLYPKFNDDIGGLGISWSGFNGFIDIPRTDSGIPGCVDNGVTTYDDSDYIYNYRFVGLFNTTYVIRFDLDDILQYPSSIDLIFRGQHIDSGQLYSCDLFATTPESGLILVANLEYDSGSLPYDSGLSHFPASYDTVIYRLNVNSGLETFSSFEEVWFQANFISPFGTGNFLYISELEVVTSGSPIAIDNNISLYLYNSGAFDTNSGINLHIETCTKDYRLQPLYDNEANPDPVESGYSGSIGESYNNYNGINGEQRWGFYSNVYFGYTDKLHFGIDDDFFEDIGCIADFWGSGGFTEYWQRDSDYIYTKPSEAPIGDDGGRIYWYEDYENLYTDFETRAAFSFQSRPYLENTEPFAAYLRFRADVDTRFKLIAATVMNDYTSLSLASSIILDGYGTCGPYEVELTSGSLVGWSGHNSSNTLMYGLFTVDEECLSDCFNYPTGLTHASQTDNNFRTQFRNMRLNVLGNTYESGKGLDNNQIEAYNNDNGSYSKHWFGFEFSGINDTTTDKYLGIKISDDTFSNWQEFQIDFYVYKNFNSGNNDIDSWTFQPQNYSNIFMNITTDSGSLTYWRQLPDNLSAVSGIQVGFYVNASQSLNSGEYTSINFKPDLKGCFIYEDKTGQGVARIGEIKITQLDVAFEVPCIPTGINDNITLYTAGCLVADSGLSLCISGGLNESLPLYTSGMYFGRSGCDLFIYGGLHEELPLFIKGFGDTGVNNLTLYIDARDSGIDYGSISNNLTLFVKSIPVASGDGLNLYIAGPDSGIDNTNLPLTIINNDSWTNKNSGMNLYLRALDSGNNTTTLYIKARDYGNTDDYYDISGDMPLYIFGTGVFSSDSGIDSYICGKMQPDSNIDLYLSVASEENNGLSLWIAGWGDSGVKTATLFTKGFGGREFNNTELFILGPDPAKSSGDLTLYINGGGTDDRNNFVDLYMAGASGGGYLNSIPLYTLGGYEFNSFALSIYNNTEVSSSATSGTLYIAGFDGTSISGLLGNTSTLVIDGAATNNNVSLTIINSGIDSLTGQIYLSMTGRDIIYDSASNNATMVAWNNYQNSNSGIDLLLYAQQNYEESGMLNLFMSRSSEADAMRTDMFISGPINENNSLEMYINGGTDSYNSLTLFMPSSIDTIVNTFKLYSHGI